MNIDAIALVVNEMQEFYDAEMVIEDDVIANWIDRLNAALREG